MGTAPFAVPSLRALAAAGHELRLVVTQPDRPGHRLKLTAPAVKVAAQELGLPVMQPERIREPAVVESLRETAPELIVVVAYGQIIPRSVLGIPRRGVVNVHASLLPRWRGAAPVAHAILAGDRFTGVTIMQMDEQLDHGPVLAQSEPVAIGAEADAAALTQRLAGIGAQLLVDTIARLDELEPRGQDHTQATPAPKLSREDGELDWSLPPAEIDRRVRAFQPWPGVTLPIAGQRVKVLRGRVEGDRYVLELVQAPGGRPRVVDGR
ncbi:MAG TPA: methionyl-tRNA formyltransferase [Candidatus Dormibacteraeota bacterium]